MGVYIYILVFFFWVVNLQKHNMTLFGNGLTLNNSSNVVGHRKSKNETDKIINWKNKMIITLKLKDVDGIAKFFQQRSTYRYVW